MNYILLYIRGWNTVEHDLNGHEVNGIHGVYGKKCYDRAFHLVIKLHDFNGMHDLIGNFCYDDFFRKTRARLYFANSCTTVLCTFRLFRNLSRLTVWLKINPLPQSSAYSSLCKCTCSTFRVREQSSRHSCCFYWLPLGKSQLTTEQCSSSFLVTPFKLFTLHCYAMLYCKTNNFVIFYRLGIALKL